VGKQRGKKRKNPRQRKGGPSSNEAGDQEGEKKRKSIVPQILNRGETLRKLDERMGKRKGALRVDEGERG